MDTYGYPISLTYKKSQTFRSAFGGVMTFLSLLGLLAFFSVQMYNVVNHKEFNLRVTSYIRDLYADQRVFNLSLNDFDVAILPTY